MNEKKEVHSRKKYTDPSRKFLDWVNNFGLEKTFLGHWIHRLDKRFSFRRMFFLWAFCFTLSILIFYNIEFTENLRVGSVAKTDVKSPFAFQIVDKNATDEKKREAEQNVLSVFDHDKNVYEEALTRVYNSFGQIRSELVAEEWDPKIFKKEKSKYLIYKTQFEKDLGAEISNRTYYWLVEIGFNKQIQDVLVRVLVDWSNHMILDGSLNTLKDTDPQIIVRNVQNSRKKEITVNRHEILDIRRKSQFNFSQVHGIESLDKKSRIYLNQLSHVLMVPQYDI